MTGMMKKRWIFLFVIGVSLALTGCASRAEAGPARTATVPAPAENTLIVETAQPGAGVTPAVVVISEGKASPTAVNTPIQAGGGVSTLSPVTPAAPPENWQDLPVVPTFSARAMEIYRHGQELGNDPHAFSKVGDCESATDWFLEDFDKSPETYSLGPYSELEAVIAYFQGSYGWQSAAANKGAKAASMLTPLWADPKRCESQETPLACEYRLRKPSFALIMLGSNDVWKIETFEGNMRKIIEYSIEQGVVPILATKADNVEKDHQVNQTIARLGAEYDIPVWNYWRAVQDLPSHGLQEDGVHLTWAQNRFDDARIMKSAWPWRNLTALQVLDAAMKAVEAQDQ